MAGTHELSMDMLQRAKNTDSREALKDYTNLATKLSRTFAAQMKTLSDWRRGGEQVVRHVHVYEGGQAVVAETIHRGGQENANLSIDPMNKARSRPVAWPAHAGHPLSVSSHARAEAVPPARRKRHEAPGAPTGNKNALKHGGSTRAHRAMMTDLRKIERNLRQGSAAVPG